MDDPGFIQFPVGLTQPPIQWTHAYEVVGSALPGIKQQEHKGDYSLLSSAKVKKRRSNTSTHLLPLRALIAHMRTTLPFFW